MKLPFDKKLLVSILTLFGIAVFALGAMKHDAEPKTLPSQTSESSVSQYAGQENNEIKSLTSDDIEALQKGTGEALGGLAKPAELSGYPGPRHVLDLKNEIGLTEDQTTQIQGLFEDMNKQAIIVGGQYIENERNITDFFKNKATDSAQLAVLLTESGRLYSELRSIHLSAHLQTIAILTEQQIEKYNLLRGYSSEDPCQNVPEGHDPELWRLHNNCD